MFVLTLKPAFAGDASLMRVRDRDLERSRPSTRAELDCGLGIAGPKKRVAELVNLVMVAREGMYDSPSVV